MRLTARFVVALATFLFCHPAAPAGPVWSSIAIADPNAVVVGGPVGESLRRGIERLSQPPFTADWLLADVSFKLNRIFTNYSGDASGRFLELASLTSPREGFSPVTLEPVIREIAKYQKADGHFGLNMDFHQPMQRQSPPFPMLWGNARLLVGLVTAAQKFQDAQLLTAARRLGDFYVATADVFCSASREAEFRATGTYGDGYACCYFPAIESLALLYRATHDDRYLAQARRMADWFRKFDTLPTDHSHGNLCAWRGILDLYELTGERAYLDRALAKWEMAVQDGYVWSLGGIGEHWYLFHGGDEGCSESDWLRFNLQLWRFTGETRFLDMAERLLHNQYCGNQCPNGGYGWRPFDGDAAGPIGTSANLDEWYFCCSFHGPLGLYFLKAYLAAGSERGIFVNFPTDFDATVKSGGTEWRIKVTTQPTTTEERQQSQITLSASGTRKPVSTTLWLRQPEWATEVRVTSSSGSPLPCSQEQGYIRLQKKLCSGERILVTFQTGLRLERRRFQPVALDPGRISRLRDVAVLDGPEILCATPAPGNGRLTLLAQIDARGKLAFWRHPDGGYMTVTLPGLEAQADQIAAALSQARVVSLRPETDLHTRRRVAFMHDVVVIPRDLLPPQALSQWATQAHNISQFSWSGGMTDHLERTPEVWLGNSGWAFITNALHITGGDVGLLDFVPKGDYRFEFDLELPQEGQGLAGWVVRAQGGGDYLLFQIQSADSPYSAPEFKTQPNTLRPHVRRYGEFSIAEPVPLPKPVRRGETHRIAVECRSPEIAVFVDGERIYAGPDAGFHTGTVGFRASGPAEQARYRNISLKRI